MSTTPPAPPAADADAPPAVERAAAVKDAAKRAAGKDAAPKRGRPSKDDQLAKALADKIAGTFGTLAAATMTMTAADDGSVELVALPGSVSRDFEIIAAQAQPLAEGLVKIAGRNPRFRKLLDQLVNGAELTGFGTTLAIGIVLPILANHSLLPPTVGALFGQPLPATSAAAAPPAP